MSVSKNARGSAPQQLEGDSGAMPRKSSMKRGAFQYQNAARVGGRSPGRRTPCRELSVTVASSRGEHTSHTNGPNANIDHAGELCPLDRHGNNKTLSSVTLTRLHYPPCAYCSPRRPADAPRAHPPRCGNKNSANSPRRPDDAVGFRGRWGTTRRATLHRSWLCRPCDQPSQKSGRRCPQRALRVGCSDTAKRILTPFPERVSEPCRTL
jgi:hypothetical protein